MCHTFEKKSNEETEHTIYLKYFAPALSHRNGHSRREIAVKRPESASEREEEGRECPGLLPRTKAGELRIHSF